MFLGRIKNLSGVLIGPFSCDFRWRSPFNFAAEIRPEINLGEPGAREGVFTCNISEAVLSRILNQNFWSIFVWQSLDW